MAIEEKKKEFKTIPSGRGKVTFEVDRWNCGQCGRERLQKEQVYIEYNGKKFCCSKCFRAYWRTKHGIK